MRKPRPFGALLAIAALLIPAAAAANLPRPAPDVAVNLLNGRQVKLSDYKGKVVAVIFILTTCPHCQKTISYLSDMQREYGARGFQVLASAIDQAARMNLPGFTQAFNPPFPVGFNRDDVAVSFMQHPPMLIPLMPMLAFVDRQGVIQSQHEGNDEYFGAAQEKNLRSTIEGMLGKSPAGAKKAAAKTKKK